MMAYVRLGRLGILFVECSRELTAWPQFSLQRYRSEIIVDLPWCRAIYTPAKRLSAAKGSLHDERAGQDVSCSSAGAAEN